MYLSDLQIVTPRPLTPVGAELEANSRVACVEFARRASRARIQTGAISKIAFKTSSPEADLPPYILLNVLMIGLQLDLETYIALDLSDRFKVLIDYLGEGIREALTFLKAPPSAASAILSTGVELKHKNLFKSKGEREPGVSGRARVAQVEVEQGLDHADVFIVLRRGTSEIARRWVATTHPSEFRFQTYFGKLAWTEDWRVRLETIDGCVHEVNFEQP